MGGKASKKENSPSAAALTSNHSGNPDQPNTGEPTGEPIVMVMEPPQKTKSSIEESEPKNLTPRYLREHLEIYTQSDKTEQITGPVPVKPHSYNEFKNDDYDTLDDRARKLLYNESSSVSTVVNQLNNKCSCSNKYDTLRAIFMWITGLTVPEKIKKVEPTVSKKSKKGKKDTPKVQLTQSSSVGKYLEKESRGERGLLEMFETMCRTVEIQTRKIKGFTKSSSYVSDTPVPLKSNHVWSGVLLEGRWYLCDVISGHGSSTYDSSYYFLTHPSTLIFSHLPADKKWQLLTRMVTEEEFSKLVYYRKVFFIADLELLSPTTTCIEMTDQRQVEIILKSPHQNQWKTTLHKTTNKLLSGGQEVDLDRFSAIGQSGKTASCYCEPPSGDYQLSILIRVESRWKLVLKFQIINKQMIKHDSITQFPAVKPNWGLSSLVDLADIQPQFDKWLFETHTRSEVQLKFDIQSDESIHTAVLMDQFQNSYERLIQVLIIKDVLVVNARLPRVGKYLLTLYKQKSTTKTILANYLIINYHMNSKKTQMYCIVPRAGLANKSAVSKTLKPTEPTEKFSVLSHKDFTITAPHTGQIDIKVLLKDTNYLLVCKLYYDGKDQCVRRGQLITQDYIIIHKIDEYRYSVRVRMPYAGYYRIQFYEELLHENARILLCCYYVTTYLSSVYTSPLPRHLPGFNPRWQLTTPESQHVEPYRNVLVSLRGPPGLQLRVKTPIGIEEMHYIDNSYSATINTGPEKITPPPPEPEKPKTTLINAPKAARKTLFKEQSKRSRIVFKQPPKSKQPQNQSRLKSGKVSPEPRSQSPDEPQPDKAEKKMKEGLGLEAYDGYVLVQKVIMEKDGTGNDEMVITPVLLFKVKTFKPKKDNSEIDMMLDDLLPEKQQEVLQASKSAAINEAEENKRRIEEFRKKKERLDKERKDDAINEVNRLKEEKAEAIRMDVERKILSSLDGSIRGREVYDGDEESGPYNLIMMSSVQPPGRPSQSRNSNSRNSPTYSGPSPVQSCPSPVDFDRNLLSLREDMSRLQKSFADILEAADISLAEPLEKVVVENEDEPMSESMKEKLRLQMVGLLRKRNSSLNNNKLNDTRSNKYKQSIKDHIRHHGLSSLEAERKRWHSYHAKISKLQRKVNEEKRRHEKQKPTIENNLKCIKDDLSILSYEDDNTRILKIRKLDHEFRLAIHESNQTQILILVQEFVNIDKQSINENTRKFFQELERTVIEAGMKRNVLSKIQALQTALDGDQVDSLSTILQSLTQDEIKDKELEILYYQSTAKLRYLQKIQDLHNTIFRLTDDEFLEIKTFNQPPAELHAALQGFLLLLGVPELMTKNWQHVQLLCDSMGREDMLNEMMTIDVRSLTVLSRVHEIISNINMDNLFDTSPPSVFLLLWATAIVNHHLCQEETTPNPADDIEQKHQLLDDLKTVCCRTLEQQNEKLRKNSKQSL